MFEQIIEIKNALALLGAEISAREQTAKLSPPAAIARIGENIGRVVGKDETGTGVITQRANSARA